MLTVMELLSFPLFRNFKLVSGYGGLYNKVSGTGIFEWESANEIETNFQQGEFVVTTLSLARSDTSLAENSIRLLIDKKVCAIAVKAIYFHEISEELKAYSDTNQVPVFFFSETFFDDIIYTVKNTLLTQNLDSSHDEQVEFLLDKSCSPTQIKRKAKEINPFFHPHIVCCFSLLKENFKWQQELKALRLNPEEMVYSVINFQQGLIIIYTVKDNSAKDLEEKLTDFLEKSGLKRFLTGLGMSDVVYGLENLGTAIQESLWASMNCRSNHIECLHFRELGLDQILYPMADNPWAKKYYEKFSSAIKVYDDRHGSKLLETLLEYIENNGDINQTAQKMFQHGNTIRYRIDKIRKLLKLDENSQSYTELSIFVRLHKIYEGKDF